MTKSINKCKSINIQLIVYNITKSSTFLCCRSPPQTNAKNDPATKNDFFTGGKHDQKILIASGRQVTC